MSSVVAKIFKHLKEHPDEFAQFASEPRAWVDEAQRSGRADFGLSERAVAELTVAFEGSAWNELTGVTSTTFTFTTPLTITGRVDVGGIAAPVNPTPVTTLTFTTPTTVTGNPSGSLIDLGGGVSVPIPILRDRPLRAQPDAQAISRLLEKTPELGPVLQKAAKDSAYAALLARISAAHTRK